MRNQKIYFTLTLIASVLLGIVLPLALGIKDPTLIATAFSSVWFLYAMIMFIIVFLIKPGLRIRVIQRKNPTIVRYDLTDSGEGRGRESEKIQYPIKSEKKSPIIYN
jgi:hypothetical protein